MKLSQVVRLNLSEKGVVIILRLNCCHPSGFTTVLFKKNDMVCITSCKDALPTKSCFCSEQDLLWCWVLGTDYWDRQTRPCSCACLHNTTVEKLVKMWPGSDMLSWLGVQTRPQRPDSSRDFSLTGQTCFTRHPTLHFVLARTEIPARSGSLRTGPRPSWWTLHIEQEPAPQYT